MTTVHEEFGGLRFDRDGLVPAVIQDAETRAVLMVGFMNAEALRQTKETGRTHFWSRSRGKLWRKGETSGHEQIVRQILINCEENTLLIQVEQIGAVCHTGYPTCFFRRIEPDGSLTTVSERAFDPDVVYGAIASEVAQPTIKSLTEQWYGAYEFLRNQPLESVSSTSKRLRAKSEAIESRIADELRELAGVLEGTHRHNDLADDLLLEGSQVLYWIAVAAVRDNLTWHQLRLDVALATTESELLRSSLVKILRSEAETWSSERSTDDLAPRLHATAALVAQACVSTGIEPMRLIEVDLAELRTRPYLKPYFESISSP